MDASAELFASIVDAPREDAPRLVYADWLEEHGDPMRAEFIRVQVEIARLEAALPGRKGNRHPRPETRAEGKISKLRRREKELLLWSAAPDETPEENIHAWMGDLYKKIPPSGCIFRRGFVDEVLVTVREWKEHYLAIASAGTVRIVNLTDYDGGSRGMKRSAMFLVVASTNR